MGIADVEGLRRSLSRSQFRSWLLFWQRNPFGPVHDDFRAGQVASAIYGSQGARAAPEDFFASLRPKEKRSGPEQWNAWKRWAQVKE